MYLNNCPIPFHDLTEIFEFLSNLPLVQLLMFDGTEVDLIDQIMHIRVTYSDGLWCITPVFITVSRSS